MKIAICDDFEEERSAIALHVQSYFSKASLSEFANGVKLVEAHEKNKFDLILLDMIMPVLNGIETAERIRAFDEVTPIIFVTTTEDFAVQSYHVLAFDYLLKPVTSQTMANCLSRFTKLVPDKRFISIEYVGVHTDILLSNIIYLESALRKVTFHLSGGKKISITAKLEDYLKLCDEPDFCRCHKSFIVNFSYVDTVSREDFCLSEGTILRISRTHLNNAKKSYFDYIFGRSSHQRSI